MYSLSEIARIVGGRLRGDGSMPVGELVYDSRKGFEKENAMFLCLKTDSGDGHLYLEQLAKQGLRAALVSEPQDPEAPFSHILVEDTLLALQQLCAYHRNRFQTEVIGITGSNGKTIVKDWLYSLLTYDGLHVLRSPKSFNSQLGVALSLWPMNKQHDLALIEAGVSKSGEMEKLEHMIRPTLGIFTHFGDSHAQGFPSDHQRIQEKLGLFAHAKAVIFREDPRVLEILNKQACTPLSWGEGPANAFQLMRRSAAGQHIDVQLQYLGESYDFRIPFMDEASFENAMHCICICLYLGRDAQELHTHILDLRQVDMRLQHVQGVNGCSLILDHYNADLSSLRMALDFYTQQSNKPKRILFLSDILGGDSTTEHHYRKIAQMVEAAGFDQVIGIGPHMVQFRHFFGKNHECYLSTEAFLSQFPLYQLKDASILIKGSRTFQFERIANALRMQVHHTVLEVNMSRMQQNLQIHRSLLPYGTRLMAMVKAYSYGSGGYQIAKLLEFNKVDYLGVAYLDEGVALRKAGISSRIMVLNPDMSNAGLLQEYHLEPVVYSMESLAQLARNLEDRSLLVHLEFDTGMHRLGFAEADLDRLLQELDRQPSIKVASVFSHLAVADDPQQDAFTQRQIDAFRSLCTAVHRSLGYDFIRHLSNSAGIQRFPEACFDMVRLGLGLYGVGSMRPKLELLPVGTFKSHVAQIREVPAGEGIGYGQHDKASVPRKIAVLGVGYADGYSRSHSRGNGEVSIRGQRAPIVGNVCMDMCMCDVTGIDCEVGDEAILFGDAIGVEELAAQRGTIPYEVLTSVSDRVNRSYFQE